jgi:CheY-like chemotaxis protein
MTLPPLQILIIDDDPLVGQALRRNLAGHQVTLAESGARALDELAADAPPAFDVILCDVMMPGKSGIDVYRDVQARFPERCGTFIFTTGGGLSGRSGEIPSGSRRAVPRKAVHPRGAVSNDRGTRRQ